MGEPARKRSFADRAIRYFEDCWPDFVTKLADLVLAVAGIVIGLHATLWGWVVFIAGVVGSLVGHIFLNRHRVHISDLVRKNQALAYCIDESRKTYYDFVSYKLSCLATELGYGDTERISLYTHENQAFILIGRFSLNPSFREKGRPCCPNGQGSIAGAFDNGSFFVGDFPDWNVDPKGYYTRQRQYGISKDEAKALTMKSRAYSAHAIHTDSSPRTRIAVIVFESIKWGILDHQNLKAIWTLPVGQDLAAFIERTQYLAPRMSNASEWGF